ncbi:MAG: hypothetical protein JNG86_08340 [Verrucomicrobiaceae bacterium]|nr:hypothetical protein [Verrucomicrobiaceae bacterium]
MKTLHLLLAGLLLASCGKEQSPKPAAAPARQEQKKDTPADLKKLAGDLPKMDPEKAKFIAAPATPADPQPVEETRKPAPPPAETPKHAEKPKTP